MLCKCSWSSHIVPAQHDTMGRVRELPFNRDPRGERGLHQPRAPRWVAVKRIWLRPQAGASMTTCVRLATGLDCATHPPVVSAWNPMSAPTLFSRSPAHAKRASIPDSEHAPHLPPVDRRDGRRVVSHEHLHRRRPKLGPGGQRWPESRHRLARRCHHVAAIRSRGRAGGARNTAKSQLRPDRSPGEGMETAVQPALLQSALQRHQRDRGHVLRPGPSARQRDHGPLLDVLGHDYADAVLRPGAGLCRYPSPHAEL